MIPGGVNPMLLSAGGSSGGYQVQRSLRLRAGATASLTRTPASAGNRITNTHSFWLKRGLLAQIQMLLAVEGGGGLDSGFINVYFDASDKLVVSGGATVWLTTTAVFRDPTAHLHVVLRIDLTQVSGPLVMKLYVNNVEVTAFTTDNRATLIGGTLPFSMASTHYIGRRNSAPQYSSDVYLSDVHFIDGQALTPTAFGQFDANGNWQPKEYDGTYGTNGFRLKFDNPASLSTLTADSSGNGNNWTATNVSLTAGATYDSMLDVPLGAGGGERGNYATLNRLSSSAVILTSANLVLNRNAASWGCVYGTIGVSSGKWVWWYRSRASGSVFESIGIARQGESLLVNPGYNSTSYAYNSFDGVKRNNVGSDGGGAAYGASFTAGDVIRVELNMDTGTLEYFKQTGGSGGFVSQGVAFTGLTGTFFPFFGMYGSEAPSVNFGQQPSGDTPTAGFKTLHTGNLTSDSVTLSGSFTGNANADGPFIWMNGAPETLTINGNAVTWGSHADKTAGGFKLRTSSASYNASGTNTWTATVLVPASNSAFRRQLAKSN